MANLVWYCLRVTAVGIVLASQIVDEMPGVTISCNVRLKKRGTLSRTITPSSENIC